MAGSSGGDMDMETGQTEAAAAQVMTATGAFDGTWEPLATQITTAVSGIGGIGSGPLGIAFHEKTQYPAKADQVGQNVRDLVGALNDWSKAVSGTVTDYTEADYSGARVIGLADKLS